MSAAISSRTRRSPEDGFTLVDALASIVVGTLLLTAFAGFYVSEQRAYRRQQVEIALSQNLRIGLEQIVRDLRVAGRDPTGSAHAGLLSSLNANQVDFTIDYDSDGTVTSTSGNERKGFRRCGTTIETYVASTSLSSSPCDGASGWQTLAESISASSPSSVFRYYKASGSSWTELTSFPLSSTDLGLVTRIDVTLTATTNAPYGAGTISRTEAATVRLRN
jgi:type IV pilus assembly protein PilW